MRPVIVLSPTLSGNAVGRALVFVDLLAGMRDVVLAGPSDGTRWLPMASRSDVEIVDLGRPGWLPSRALRSLFASSTAIVVKPLHSSFGQWLLAGRPGPAVLDIDDPEQALYRMDARTLVRSALSRNGPVSTAIMLRCTGFANAITVSNHTLCSRPGAVVIPHARDERLFGAFEDAARREARRELGVDVAGDLIVFVGTSRPHKGVDVLIEAAAHVAPAHVAIVGATRARQAPPNVTFHPPVAYETVIRWLVAADIVAVPQRPGPIGRQQAPAKIVDALAAGRAIVASDLPPIREMVGSEALLVTPGSVPALVAGLRSMLLDPARRRGLEAGARARFIERYSLRAVRPTLERVLISAERTATS